MRKAGWIWLIGVCIMLWFGVVQAEKLDRIVAVVNGDIILYSELQERIHLLAKISPEFKATDPNRAAQLERDVLQQMVRERLTEQEVKRLKITVSEREVDAAIDNIKRENNLNEDQFNALLQREGKTVKQLREDIRREIERSRLVERVLKSKTVITEEQIDAFAKSEGSAPSNPGAKRHLAVIFLAIAEEAGEKRRAETEKLAHELYEKLRNGSDFGSLAKEFSQGPAAQEGGDIGLVATDELAPAIMKVVRELKVNEFSSPLKTEAGFYIVKVIGVQTEKPDTADPKIREKVRKQLFQREVNRKFEEWVHDLEVRSFIQISL